MIEQLVRPNIRAMKAYSSARDEHNSQDDVALLDANENPFNWDYNRYPDPYQKELKKVIASLKSVDDSKIFIGNGSDEAIDLIYRIFCEPEIENVIIPDPTYGMYQVSAAIQNVQIKRVPLSSNFELNAETILEACDSRTKVIWLCNPNNPSGNLLDLNEMEKIVEKFRGIVVVDEAYIDFTSTLSFTTKLKKFENLIVLQTFSKAWGMANMRIGLAFANESIIQFFNKVKAPYNISGLTQKTTIDLLKNNQQRVSDHIKRILSERKNLLNELNKLKCVEKIFESDTNFLLVRFTNHQQIFQLLISNSLIVRDRSSALHCKGCLRITIGTEDENKRLIEILKTI